jgi:hypothetical protein
MTVTAFARLLHADIKSGCKARAIHTFHTIKRKEKAADDGAQSEVCFIATGYRAWRRRRKQACHSV